jgi:hypothetical protein
LAHQKWPGSKLCGAISVLGKIFKCLRLICHVKPGQRAPALKYRRQANNGFKALQLIFEILFQDFCDALISCVETASRSAAYISVKRVNL